MKEFIDKLIERLREESYFARPRGMETETVVEIGTAISIVNELAEEYINTSTEHINCSTDTSTISKMENVCWIPCSERLPEVDGRYLCSYHYKDGGRNYVQVLSYYAYDEKPHFQHEGYEGLEVVAWCELPAPYTENKVSEMPTGWKQNITERFERVE